MGEQTTAMAAAVLAFGNQRVPGKPVGDRAVSRGCSAASLIRRERSQQTSVQLRNDLIALMTLGLILIHSSGECACVCVCVWGGSNHDRFDQKPRGALRGRDTVTPRPFLPPPSPSVSLTPVSQSSLPSVRFLARWAPVWALRCCLPGPCPPTPPLVPPPVARPVPSGVPGGE